MQFNKHFNSILKYLTATIMAVILVACAKDNDSDNITVSTETLNFSWQAGEQSFDIKADKEFVISSPYDWISISKAQYPAGSYTITVAVAQNPETEFRIGEIYIAVNGQKATVINVVQEPNSKLAGLDIQHDDTNLNSAKQTFNLNVTTKYDFRVWTNEKWLVRSDTTCTSGENIKISVGVERNKLMLPRTGYIYIKSIQTNMADSIEIVQSAFEPMFTLSPDTLKIDGNHGILSFSASCDTDFRITSQASWIKIPSDYHFAADSTYSISLDIARNTTESTRTGYVILTSEVSYTLRDTLVVVQTKRIPSVDNDITLLTFKKSQNPSLSKDYAFAPDASGKITGRIPEPVDIRNLIATYTTSAAQLYINSAEQTNGATKHDFTQVITIKAVAESGAVKTYTIDLTHFTGLPVLYINTDSHQEIASKNTYEGASIYIMGGRNFGDLAFQQMEIHGRGNSSWDTFRKKPSYTFKLNTSQNILGMPKSKKWVLIGNYRDKTLLRNNVGWWLSSQLPALKWTPRYQHVELVLNGTHRGVYQLAEQVRIDDDRVNINEMLPTDTKGDAITGGYIIELDRGSDADQWGWAMPFMLGSSHRANIKQPKIDESNLKQRDYIYGYLSHVDSLLGQSTDMTYVMNTYIDMPSWAAQWLVFELTGTTEPNGPNSWYTYKDKNDLKWYCGPSWDFDYRSFIPSTANGWITASAIYMRYMRRYRPFENELRAQWAILRPKMTDLIKYINQQREYMRLSAEANWAIHDQNLIDDGRHENGDEQMTSDAAIDRMISYIKLKWTFVSNNINNM